MLGINHFDPRQPEAVALQLRQLQSKYGAIPAFAAVEADEHLHETVSKQKGALRALLLEEWPNLSESELTVLEASFLFEPEAHKQVWNSLPIVWLDAGRTLENRVKNHHAIFRVQTFKSWLGRKSLHNSLAKLGNKAWEAADANCVDLDRSRAFYERLINAAKNYSGKWAFVVVGAGHTDDTRTGTMANLLAERKEICIHRHVLR